MLKYLLGKHHSEEVKRDGIDFDQAMSTVRKNKNRGISKYYKSYDGFADIEIQPKFTIQTNAKFFTIGSCFARNIENYLKRHNIPLLSQMPNVKGEHFKIGGVDRTGYQNVYTPGSVLEYSRLLLKEDKFHSIAENNGLYYDLLTHGLKGLSLEEAREIRNGIVDTYKRLKDTDVLIITLGYVEAWYYKKDESWVNQSCADPKLRDLKEDFEFVMMDYNFIKTVLNEAFINFKKINPNMKFILTVSPVPLNATFSTNHIVIANQRSKSLLHAASQYFMSERNDLDYFPSYEMVSLSRRELAFEDDNIHVKPSLVAKVMDRFFSTYIS